MIVLITEIGLYLRQEDETELVAVRPRYCQCN